MTKAQIFEELPNLSPDERKEIFCKIQEIDAEGWLASDLSADEGALIEDRLVAHRKEPQAVLLWSDIERRLSRRFG